MVDYTYYANTQLYGNLWRSSGAPYYNLTYASKPVMYDTDIHPSFYNALYGSVNDVIAFLSATNMGLWYNPTLGQYYIGTQADNPFTPETDPYTPPPINGDKTNGGLWGTGCFIATAAYGTSLHADLNVLRHFRDTSMPRSLIELYYKYSPSVARIIGKSSALRWCVRQPIKIIVKILKRVGPGD